MKSVGEVMAIGRTFQESLQKALRGLESGVDGFNLKTVDPDTIADELAYPRAERLWYVADALAIGMPLEEVYAHTRIDRWFLSQIKEIVDTELAIEKRALDDFGADELRSLKRMGFSDRRLAHLWKKNEGDVRARRHGFGIRPVYKRVDTCAAEFSTRTAYMYSTYEDECEAHPTDRRKVIVLGGGPNRIGQGIEFDYCCVHAALALREDGYETIMVNCNPETVSTDYDTSDRLYFEPLTLEDVLEIVHVEKPFGVIVQYGGQTPLKLARDLEANGVPIIGTTPDMIDMAEDRERFQQMLHLPRKSAIHWSSDRRTCSAAGRWKSYTSSAISSVTCGRRSKCRTIHRCCSTDSSTMRSKSMSTRWSTTAAMARPSSSAASWSTSSRRASIRAIRLARCPRSRCPRRCRTSCDARRWPWRMASTSSD
jgi:carbamoyl-phosphate synthase large subunit